MGRHPGGIRLASAAHLAVNSWTKAKYESADGAALNHGDVAKDNHYKHDPLQVLAIVAVLVLELLVARGVVLPVDHVSVDEPPSVSHVEEAVEHQESMVLAVVALDVGVVAPGEDHVEQIIVELNVHPHSQRGYRALRHVAHAVQKPKNDDHEAHAAVVQLLVLYAVHLDASLLRLEGVAPHWLLGGGNHHLGVKRQAVISLRRSVLKLGVRALASGVHLGLVLTLIVLGRVALRSCDSVLVHYVAPTEQIVVPILSGIKTMAGGGCNLLVSHQLLPMRLREKQGLPVGLRKGVGVAPGRGVEVSCERRAAAT